MKSKFPKASILTFITQFEDDKERLLFMYLRPVPDWYPDNTIHWYQGAGNNGTPNTVWERLSIRQWTACGWDTTLNNLFNSILDTKSVSIDGRQLNLLVPVFEHVSNQGPVTNSRSESVSDCYLTKHNDLIPKEMFQEGNLKFLSGYKRGSAEIKPLFPIGFFADNFIYDKLKADVWAVRETRLPYLTFHGVRSTADKVNGSNQMVGFYQQNFDSATEYTAVVSNEERLEIGRSTIEKQNGFFKIPLSEPNWKGTVHVLGNNQLERGNQYVLIRDIQINAELARTTFKDAYGRSFMVTSATSDPVPSIPPFTWQQEVFVNEDEGNMKLSDLFKAIFSYLGPRIVVADPYFINDFYDKDANVFSVSNCQRAFFNALFHTAVERGITELVVLGCSRVTSQVHKDEVGTPKFDLLMNTYEQTVRKFINDSKIGTHFPASAISFRRANRDFHNRYWFSITNQNGKDVFDKCVIITNSIGNMKEVDLIPINDPGQVRQIGRKYIELYQGAEVKLTI